MSTVVEPTREDIFWGKAQLDRTPVGDIEAWTHSYDPRAAAALDRRLDEAFGSIGGSR